MIKRLILLGRDDGCYEMLLDDLVTILKQFRIARYYVKSSVEMWNARQIYFDSSDYFFIVFPHLVTIPFPEKRYWTLFSENNTKNKISQLYNTEIVGTLLLNSIKNFDHSQQNIKVWKNYIPDLSIHLLPPPIFSRFIIERNDVKRYDVLFYGKLSERRKVILRAIQSRFGSFRYCISAKMTGSQLDQALRESKVVVNLHQHDDNTTLNQIKLHEMMRYNIFIVNEIPSEYEEEMITNYKCCVEFVEQVKKDLSNISSLFSIIDDLVAKANLKNCEFNLKYRQLFQNHYPRLSF